MSKHDWVQSYLENIEAMQPDVFFTPPDFFSSVEMRAMGIECGERCMLHKNTTVINPSKLKLGNDVRIDGYSVISCGIGITIGNSVHLASHLVLMGGAGIEIQDYASVASGAKILSVSDDVMGRGLVGPCVPLEKRHLHSGKVTLKAHSVMAVNTVMMPGSVLSKGSTLLPFSLLNNAKTINDTDFVVYSGMPAEPIKRKLQQFLKMVKDTE
jgi:acetyltransferase-like isoleucine patch superfamily enzyme